MVKIFSIFVMMLSVQVLYSQNIIPYYNENNSLTIHDLWDVEISSPTLTNTICYLTFELYNGDGVKMIEAKSQTFFIKDKAYSVSSDMANNSPYIYNFSNEKWKKACEKSGSIIPSGNYKILYTLFRTTDGCNWTGERILQIWIPLEISFFNSLDLVFPFNFDTINQTNPVFKWMPLISSEISDDIVYQISLFDIFKGQTPEQSATYNPAFFINNLTETNIVYPLFSKKLQPGNSYAWQVFALKNNKPIARSEIWTFTVSQLSNDNSSMEFPEVFFTLSSEPGTDKWNKVSGNYLYFKIETEKNSLRKLSYKITDVQNNNRTVISGEKDPLSVSYGKNLYALPVTVLTNGNKYTLTVFTDNKKFYLNFIR